MGNEQQHIPIPSDPKDEKHDENTNSNNPIAKVADPVGQGLETTLRPVGAGLEKITGPLGNAVGGITRPALGPLMGNKEEKMEVVGGENKDSYAHKPEKIAGKEQTGDNPLGLDQTGRWGFRDE
jgi:hypothetical protein